MGAMNKNGLKLDWCSHKAALYAVRHWHYSRSLPAGKSVKVGIWENGRFIGVVIYSLGSNKWIGRPYRLPQTQVCELTRVALDRHQAPVSRIVSISLKLLRQHCPGLRLVVSYADTERGHIGSIYQAGNWLYEGAMPTNPLKMLRGRLCHPRSVGAKYGTHSLEWLRRHVDPNARNVAGKPKHKYLMPLDDEMRRQLLPRQKPYPKQRAGTIDADGPAIQAGQGGSSPTPALQINPAADRRVHV